MIRVRNMRVGKPSIRFIPHKSEHRLVKVGRWGPRWLHRLVWTMARNLGMIQHPVEREVIKTWHPVQSDKAIKAIQESALAYLNRDFYREDLVAYVGPEMWMNAMRDEASCFTIDFQFGRSVGGTSERRIMGIPVIVMPEIEGCLVVPRPEAA
jgi:hypothetical protein